MRSGTPRRQADRRISGLPTTPPRARWRAPSLIAHHRASLITTRALVLLRRAAHASEEEEVSGVGAADAGPTSGSSTTLFFLVVSTTDLGSTALPTTAMTGPTSASWRRR